MAGILDAIFGTRPQVAPFIPTDPIATLEQLLQGEIKDWGSITQISDLYEQYMLDAFSQALGPDFKSFLSLGTTDATQLEKQAGSLISGQIPPDVAAQVARSAAFQSLGSGTLGGPMASALTARDLGLTSLNLETQGANLLGSAQNTGNALQRWAQALTLPPSASMYSPASYLQFVAQQNAARQATQQEKFNVAAQPNPIAKGITDLGAYILGAYLSSGRSLGNTSIFNTSQTGTGLNPATFASTSASAAGSSVPGWESSIASLLGSTSGPQTGTNTGILGGLLGLLMGSGSGSTTTGATGSTQTNPLQSLLNMFSSNTQTSTDTTVPYLNPDTSAFNAATAPGVASSGLMSSPGETTTGSLVAGAPLPQDYFSSTYLQQMLGMS